MNTQVWGYAMFGRKVYVLMVLAVLGTGACSKRNEEKITEQELTQRLDKKDYEGVLRWFQTQTDAELIKKFEVYKAYAYIGIGKLEPIEFVIRLRSQPKFSDAKLESFFVNSNCASEKFPKDFKGSEKCLSLRLFNQVPSPDDKNLRLASSVLRSLRDQGRLSEQDLLLMGFLEAVFVVARVKNVLLYYAKLNPDTLTYEQAAMLFEELHSAGDDMTNFVAALKNNKDLLSEKLTGSRHLALFQNDPRGKVEFLEVTGIPMFLKVSSMDQEDGVAQVGRNAIIQVLDQGVEFFNQ